MHANQVWWVWQLWYHSFLFFKKNAIILKGKTDQFAPQIQLKKLDVCKAYINVCVHEV